MRPLPDARTDECAVLIAQPGSYYVERQLVAETGKHGILIDCDGVSLDLNGYEILGCAGSKSGIVVRADSGAVVRNGTVRKWGGCGIDADVSSCSHLEGVRVIDCVEDGVRLGPSGSADDVTACDSGRIGIVASVSCTLHDCRAFSNASHGMSCDENCRVIDSSATANAQSGFVLGTGSQARACSAKHNLASGFYAASLVSLTECDAIANELDGIHTGGQCVVMRCRSHGSRKGSGINVRGQGTRIDENTCSENRIGICLSQPGNIVTRNAIAANAETAIEAVLGNHVAKLVAQPDDVRIEISWSNFVL